MAELCRHGFGELEDRKLHAFQFDFYATIADTIPAWELVLPDDLSRLPLCADRLAQVLSD